MHEESKLQEARHFYECMQKCEGDYTAISYTLRAFLSAARSVLQYALEEVDPKLPNGRAGGPRRAWYDDQIRTGVTLSFFGKKRNVDVHEKPVQPSQDVTVSLTAGVTASASIGVLVIDAEGNVIKTIAVEESMPAPPPPDSPTTTTYRYRFADWPGSEDLMLLCKLYLDELEAVVADGQVKGFLTASECPIR